MSKNTKEYVLDATRAHTAISLLVAAQEMLEQSTRDARVNGSEIAKLVKKIIVLRRKAYSDLVAATENILLDA